MTESPLLLRRTNWIYWFGLFLVYVGLITLTGALIGALAFITVNFVFGLSYPASIAALAGIKDGAFYAFIWAPALSLVRCVMLWYRSRKHA